MADFRNLSVNIEQDEHRIITNCELVMFCNFCRSIIVSYHKSYEYITVVEILRNKQSCFPWPCQVCSLVSENNIRTNVQFTISIAIASPAWCLCGLWIRQGQIFCQQFQGRNPSLIQTELSGLQTNFIAILVKGWILHANWKAELSWLECYASADINTPFEYSRPFSQALISHTVWLNTEEG